MGKMNMLAKSRMGQTRLNFKDVVALIVDRDPYARGLVGQMLRGFGISTILTAGNGQEAKELLAHHKPEVVFIEGELPDMPSGELIGWIRHNPDKSLRFLPIIVLSGYTQLRMVAGARDAGAHMVIRKPVSPQTLFDRLAWVANFDRPFMQSSAYAGPDRRFHEVPTPDDQLERKTDQPQSAIPKV
jgi:CheY-like chemotaxis protein